LSAERSALNVERYLQASVLRAPATRAHYTELARQAGVPLRQYVVREQLRHHD
jgi:hypothetical protein